MNFSKKTIVLRGGRGGVLTLTGGKNVEYSLLRGFVEGAILVLFFDEYSFIELENATGKLDITDINKIRAAVVQKDGIFMMMGSAGGKFDFECAKTNYRIKRKKQNELDCTIFSDKKAENIELLQTEKPVCEKNQGESEEKNIQQNVDIIQEEENKEKDVICENEATQCSEDTQINDTNVSLVQDDGEGEDECPVVPTVRSVSPFSHIFKESQWQRMELNVGGGTVHHLSGEIYKNGVRVAQAVAIPGAYSVTSPPWLEGFNVYLNAHGESLGYWVSVRSEQDGRVLSPQEVRTLF